jgi:Tol biopolymer transport system component/tRNA A-37 threonylcarbamoyl transferase component Bud32
MSLQPGQRLGAYEVIAAIGAGGMGEVYRARDTKLHRDIALKILPQTFAFDPDRVARFEREAQVLASLNHTNIAGIYGLEDAGGVKALALELVEGPTLADRIAEGPIPVDDALAIARQIADALEAAHEAGVIHRDLKPANIKLKPDGTVKVLDFGLAKLATGSGPAAGPDVTASPTITTPAMTSVGVILGTAAYMAPEQARGKAVDKRADIWAFGCVLYEMLTGRRAFDGDDITMVLASIIKSEPDWTVLPADTPAGVRAALKQCLQKDTKQRLRDIGDMRLALDGAFESPHAAPPPDKTPYAVAVWRRPAVVGPAALMAGALGASLAVWLLTRPAPAPINRLTIAHQAPEVVGGINVDVAISSDSRRVVYLASGGGQSRMYVRPLESLTSTRLGTADNVGTVFMSPDGQWVGFEDLAERSLKKIAVSGGTALTICRLLPNMSLRGASWAPDDTIIFGTSTAGLFRVAAGGGMPEPLTKPDAGQGEQFHGLPDILPGGEKVLFTIRPLDGDPDNARVAVLDLRTGTHRVLMQGGTHPRYVSTGHLVYANAGTLRAVRFDLDRLAVGNSPVSVLEGVVTKGQGTASFSLSPTGTLTYIAGHAGVARRTLVWVDRQGREEPIKVPPRAYAYARLSPDGTRVALDVREEMNDIWIWDLPRETLTRLTFDPGLNRGPIWTPDGRRVAFSAARDGAEAIYWQAADGSGVAEQLTQGKDIQVPHSFSPDGTKLLFEQPGNAPYDIGVISLTGERKAEMILHKEFSEAHADISPNGRWIAYESDESGRNEVYVRPFPEVNTGRWQISTEGGTRPLWARNGRELFYYVPPGVVMAVPVVDGVSFAAGAPKVVFKGTYLAPQSGRMYDVSPDAQRFLMIKEAREDGEAPPPPQLVVVQNWFEELKRLVPVN